MKAGRFIARFFAIALFSLAFGVGLFFKDEMSLMGVAAFVYLNILITAAILAVSQERHQRRWIFVACALTFGLPVLSLLIFATTEVIIFSDVLKVFAFAFIVSGLIIFAARGVNEA